MVFVKLPQNSKGTARRVSLRRILGKARCSGTVYAVIYVVDNTRNRSEPGLGGGGGWGLTGNYIQSRVSTPWLFLSATSSLGLSRQTKIGVIRCIQNQHQTANSPF